MLLTLFFSLFTGTIKSFYHSIAPQLILQFKHTAYRLAGIDINLEDYNSNANAINGDISSNKKNKTSSNKHLLRLVIAHRGNDHYREMQNPKVLQEYLVSKLANTVVKSSDSNDNAIMNMEVLLDLYDTSKKEITYVDQIATVTNYDVVICMCTAFL